MTREELLKRFHCPLTIDDKLDAYREGVIAGASVVKDVKVEKREHITPKVTLDLGKKQVQVVVTVCDKDKQYLKECLTSISTQTVKPFGETLIGYDGTDVSELDEALRGFDNMRVLLATDSDFGTTRNILLAKGNSEFFLCLDADDWYEPNYIEEMLKCFDDPTVGFAYPDMQHFGAYEQLVKMPDEFDYNLLRERNFVPSPSMYRREAFLQAGGWPSWNDTPNIDWHLALRTSALGWIGAKANTLMHYRRYDESVTFSNQFQAGKWAARCGGDARTLGLATLFSGRTDCLEYYFNWLDTQTYSKEKVELFFFDNSNSENFSVRLREYLARCKYANFTYRKILFSLSDLIELKSGKRVEWQEDVDGNRKFLSPDISTLLAHHYNIIGDTVWCDDILILEDDVVPPLDAINTLRNALIGNAMAVSGFVQSRFSGTTTQHKMVKFTPPRQKAVNPIGDAPIAVDMTGMGCTLFRKRLFDEFVLRGFYDYASQWQGQDLGFCRDARMAGYKLLAHPKVKCKHYGRDGKCFSFD